MRRSFFLLNLCKFIKKIMLFFKFVLPFFLAIIQFGNCWNIFPSVPNSVSIEKFAKQKMSSLKSLRQLLTSTTTEIGESGALKDASTTNSLMSTTDTQPLDSLGEYLNSSDKVPRENLLQQLIPNKEEIFNRISEMGDKIVEVKERVEPEVKKFLTARYNSFLNNLIPYSETIGVPIYVLNSLKIPQNFDPRLQLINSMLKSGSLSKLFSAKGKLTRSTNPGVQGRSDDQDFVTDQEPDATSRGFNKYRHLYLNAPRSRSKSFAIPDRNGYEVHYDSVDPYDAEASHPSGDTQIGKGYYIEDSPYDSSSDLYASAGSNSARGWGWSNSRGDYGHSSHGHGGGHGGGGLTDPFTILGSLAFFTYLAMLIQQSMTTTAAPAGGGRNGREEVRNEFDTEHLMKMMPEIVAKLKKSGKLTQLWNQYQATLAANKKMTNKKKTPPTKKPTTSKPEKCTNLCQLLNKVKRLKDSALWKA